MDIEKLNKLFGRDITKCRRCKGTCNIGMSQCIEYREDGELAYDYGEQIYLSCPSCKRENISPYSSFLIVPNED